MKSGDLMSLSLTELASLVAGVAAVAAVAISSTKLLLEQRKTKKETEYIKRGLEHLAQFVQSYAQSQEHTQELDRQKFTYKIITDTAKGIWEWAKYENEQGNMEE